MTTLSSKTRSNWLFSTAPSGIAAAAALMLLAMTDAIGPRLAVALFLALGGAILVMTAQRRLRGQACDGETQTLKNLLHFTNAIHGAGQPQQVYDALAQTLQTELNLAGLLLLGTGGELAETRVLSQFPADLCHTDTPADLEQGSCPCLRQNLPREFKAHCSPIRCAVDRAIRLDADHSAYCIPITTGTRGSYLVHMLLPPAAEWTDDRKQLAQGYVNAACSALMSLQLLLEAQQRSMTDPLTQLYNRLSMEQLVGREIALAERHDLPFTLVMIDLDEFKQINDGFGHAAGDHLLRSLADCIRMTLRKTDLAFRLGGDEFVIALPQTGVEKAQRVVEKLRQAFAAVDFSSAVANLEKHPTLSIGLAERSRAFHLVTLPALLSAADQALYDAKRENRNCVRVYAAA